MRTGWKGKRAMKEQERQYKPKIVRAKINIPYRDWKEYREEWKGQGFTGRDFKNMQKADQYFNGLELLLSSWSYDHHSCWHLYSWEKSIDERVKLAMYHAEQYSPFPAYRDDFEGFCGDWEAGRYEPGGVYTFSHDQVEVLEVLQEEEDNIDHERTEKAVRQAREAEFQKRRRERATKRKYRPKRRK